MSNAPPLNLDFINYAPIFTANPQKFHQTTPLIKWVLMIPTSWIIIDEVG